MLLQDNNDGIEATAKRFATSPKEEQKFINDASALRLFTKQTHNSLNGLLGIFSTLSALLLIGVIYFSARWGRLANFGLQLFIVGVPGSLLGLLLTNPPKNGDSALGFLPGDIATELGVVIGEVYYWIAISGLLILLLALIGRVISFVTKKTTRKPPTTNDAKPKTTTTT